MTTGKDKVFSGHQPNFLPYMGLFYKMFRSDVFVLDDDVQYTNNGNHNSNFIKLDNRKFQIIVPVKQTMGQKLNEVEIFYGSKWDRKMLKTIYSNYRRTEHFDETYEMLERILSKKYERISDLNTDFIREISERIGIRCEIKIASKDVPTELMKNERNIYQCKKLGCNTYYSGTGGRAYNDEEMYEGEGIKIIYSDYIPVRYRQRGDVFIENMSVIDYLFNEGFEIPDEWKE